MDITYSIFELFGGIRPMARAIGEAPSTVASWKRGGRIPADKQRSVLEIGQDIGLTITAEHVVFPLGQPIAAPLSDISEQPTPVCFHRTHKMKPGEQP